MCEQQDIEARRAQDLKRWHRRVAERRARGTCLKCGLCRTPHKPHDVEFVVMLSKVEVSMYSKGLTANPFT